MDPRAQFQLHPLLVRNAQLQELQIRRPNAGHQPRQHPYATPKIHTLRGRILQHRARLDASKAGQAVQCIYQHK